MRLLCFYGAADQAAAFSAWALKTPAWLEVRAVELPGHRAHQSEGVRPMGMRNEPGGGEPGGGEADAASIASTVATERAEAISSLVDLIAPLCTLVCAMPSAALAPQVSVVGFQSVPAA